MGGSRMRVLVGVALAFVVITSATAGAQVPAKKKAPKPLADACKIVTQADATTFLGESVTQTGGGTSCDYVSAGGIGVITVRIRPLTATDVPFTKKQIRATANATFPKLGDAASVMVAPGGGGDAQILLGKSLLDVSARKGDDQGNVIDLDPAAFTAFAKAAFTKMTGGTSAS